MTASSSPSSAAALTSDQREDTLRRFRKHQAAWDRNSALRALYQEWYERIRQALEGAAPGLHIEIGSGPGFARTFIPELLLTDLVAAPWHDLEVDSNHLPYPDGELGAIVLLDVLHHLASPAGFFDEAIRALAPGGRIVICDPYIGPLSYLVYKFFHEEPFDLSVDAVNLDLDPAKDPFDSNQAIATLLFGRQRLKFEQRFPQLEIITTERMAGLSYPASGGFSRRPLLPEGAWKLLRAGERRLPRFLNPWIGFRMFVVLQRR